MKNNNFVLLTALQLSGGAKTAGMNINGGSLRRVCFNNQMALNDDARQLIEDALEEGTLTERQVNDLLNELLTLL